MDISSMPVIISLAFFAMVGFIVWTTSANRTRQRALHAEVQQHLIDKFTNAPEFVEFLSSDIGKEFLAGVDKMPSLLARDRIVGGFSRGIITSLVGLGFLAIWLLDNNRGFLYPGFIVLGLGLGFFLSTLASLKLSKVYGLIPDDKPASSTDLSVTHS
jgi:hypothetical protein